MSSTKILSAEKYSSVPFFRFTFRQNFQHHLLYLIIAVLVMVLPTIMMIDDYHDWVGQHYSYVNDRYQYRIEDYVETIAVIGLFVSGGIAVLAGMSTASYVNSKQNVGCYHSFPVRRETILACESLTRVLYYADAMVFGYAVPYLILLAGLPSDAVLAKLGTYLQFAVAGVLIFLMIYSAFLFAGSLTGTSVMRFLMVLVIFFLPIVLYALSIALASVGDSRLYDSFYLNEKNIHYICSPVRLILGLTEMIDDGSMTKLFTTLIDTAFFTAGAFLLHKFRRSEASGNSIVWKPVFQIVKFAVITVCALFGGWFFSQALGVSNTVYALLIGTVIGGVLALILSNCILYRSSRAMFRGMKSFAVCMAGVFVFMLLVPLNVTGHLADFYSPSATSELYIRPTSLDTELKFDDPEEIEAILNMLEDSKSMYSGDKLDAMPIFDPAENDLYDWLDEDYQITSYEYYDEEKGMNVYGLQYDRAYPVATQRIIVVQKPKFGVPLAVYVNADVNSAFMDAIYNSRQLTEKLNLSTWLEEEKIREVEIYLDERELRVYGDEGEGNYSDSIRDDYGLSFSNPAVWRSVMQILDSCAYNPSFRESSPVVGNIRVYYEVDDEITSTSSGTETVVVPIYADDIDLLNNVMHTMLMAKAEYTHMYVDWKPFETAMDYYENVLSLITDNSFILMVDLKTGEAKQIDKETFLSLADYTASYLSGEKWYITSVIKPAESRYAFLYQRSHHNDIVVRFRKDAIADVQLGDIFADIAE